MGVDPTDAHVEWQTLVLSRTDAENKKKEKKIKGLNFNFLIIYAQCRETPECTKSNKEQRGIRDIQKVQKIRIGMITTSS